MAKSLDLWLYVESKQMVVPFYVDICPLRSGRRPATHLIQDTKQLLVIVMTTFGHYQFGLGSKL